MNFKKLFLLIALTMAFSYSNAQEIGLRFGDVTGGNVAIDGILNTGKNRIHADLSFGHGLGIDVLWDLLYKPLNPQELHWYVGIGPSMLIDDPFWLGVSGELGMEYHFRNVPISLGLDWRPTVFLIDETEFAAEGFGFNVRYVINKPD